jgi:hypothetical protein
VKRRHDDRKAGLKKMKPEKLSCDDRFQILVEAHQSLLMLVDSEKQVCIQM